jgi:hypothetical protein
MNKEMTPEIIKRTNKNMIAGVIVRHGTDLITACKLAGDLDFNKALVKLEKQKLSEHTKQRRKELLGYGKRAIDYFFVPCSIDSQYVFSFENACKYLDLDPVWMRKWLLEKLPEHIKGKVPMILRPQTWSTIKEQNEEMLTEITKQLRKTMSAKNEKHKKFLPKKYDSYKPRLVTRNVQEDVTYGIADRYEEYEILEECQKCKEECKQSDAPGLTRIFCQKLGKELITQQ